MAASSDGATPTLVGYGPLVEDAAAYRDAARRVLMVTGERAPAMLQGLVTADISEPGTGAAWPSLVLTPKGRVLADAVVLRLGDLMLLDVPEAAWAALESHFGRYLPPRFAGLEPAGLSVLRVRGPNAIAAAGALAPSLSGIAEPVSHPDAGMRFHAVRFGDGAAVRTGGLTGDGLDLYVPDDQASGYLEDLASVSAEAWDAWRIERGVPVYGRDIGEDNLPQETGLVAGTTSFRKGCYTGQEVLARIHYRGKVHRRLVGLRREEGVLEAGQSIRAADREVGAVTSAALSPRFGWIGLGLARREVADGREVMLENSGATARVVALPFADDSR